MTTSKCPKCGGRMGRLPLHERAGESPKELLYKDRSAKTLTGIRSAGVRVVVCTHCGYLEEYMHRAHRVRWDQVEGFEWIEEPEGPEQGPYR